MQFGQPKFQWKFQRSGHTYHFLQLLWRKSQQTTLQIESTKWCILQEISARKEFRSNFSASDWKIEDCRCWYGWGDDVKRVVHQCCDSTPVSQAHHTSATSGFVTLLEMCIWEPLTDRLCPCCHFYIPISARYGGILVSQSFLIWTTTGLQLFPLLQLLWLHWYHLNCRGRRNKSTFVQASAPHLKVTLLSSQLFWQIHYVATNSKENC